MTKKELIRYKQENNLSDEWLYDQAVKKTLESCLELFDFTNGGGSDPTMSKDEKRQWFRGIIKEQAEEFSKNTKEGNT